MYTRILSVAVFALVVATVAYRLEFFAQRHDVRTDAYTADEPDWTDGMTYTR